MYDDIVNLGEWEGVAGQPAKMVGTITYDTLAEFDIRQTDSAAAYIKDHAKSAKPFFMDINFIKMHNPTNAAPVSEHHALCWWCVDRSGSELATSG